MTFHETPKISSFINNIMAVLVSRLVIVTMTNGTYQYSNVPAEVMAMFLVAESKGAFLNKHIKGTYPAIKLS